MTMLTNDDSFKSGELTFTGPEAAQLSAIKGALSLELKGMKRRGRSAYAIAKELYGLKGSKQKVFDQLQEIVDNMTRVN